MGSRRGAAAIPRVLGPKWWPLAAQSEIESSRCWLAGCRKSIGGYVPAITGARLERQHSLQDKILVSRTLSDPGWLMPALFEPSMKLRRRRLGVVSPRAAGAGPAHA